jgi:hypothetical protein
MFTLSPLEGVLLAAGVLAFTTALVIGVFFAFPRSGREVAAYVRCPMLGRALGARLVRDDWTRRFDRVVRCDALGPCAPVVCNQGCLRARVAVPA